MKCSLGGMNLGRVATGGGYEKGFSGVANFSHTVDTTPEFSFPFESHFG